MGSTRDIDDALERLADIHAQVSRSSHFAGYRARTVASTGVIALVAAALEARLIDVTPRAHALFWVAIALISASICAVDIFVLRRKLPSRTTRAALGQLVPALCVGAVFGFAFRYQEVLLPGAWTTAFGLGVLASAPHLPKAIFGVALLYVGAGSAMLIAASTGAAPSPWTMGLTFGVGQLASAAALERDAIARSESDE